MPSYRLKNSSMADKEGFYEVIHRETHSQQSNEAPLRGEDTRGDLCQDFQSINITSRRNIFPRHYYTNQKRPPPGKWWWKSPGGFYIAAGGIIICDTQIIDGVEKGGIWVLKEKSRKGPGTEYTDVGGKYDWNDGDIYATISREFREELYNTDEIPYSRIKELFKDADKKTPDIASGKNGQVFFMRKGKYLCLIVDRKLLPPLQLNAQKVESARLKILNENSFCKDEMYRTMSLKFLPFDEIADSKIFLSYRLVTILKDSHLKDKIPNSHLLETHRIFNRNPRYSNFERRYDNHPYGTIQPNPPDS